MMFGVLTWHWVAVFIQVAATEAKIFGKVRETVGKIRLAKMIKGQMEVAVQKMPMITDQINCVDRFNGVADDEIQWLHILNDQATWMHVFEAIQLENDDGHRII